MAKAILIAEDDDDDAWLIAQTLTKAGIKNPLKRARDGADVIAYFKGEGAFGNRKEFPMPGIVLLDLKMRRIGGLAVMEWLRDQEKFRCDRLVVVISGQYNEEDLRRACSLGARAFLIKPCTRHDVMSLVRAYPSCWDRNKPEQSLILGHEAPRSGGESARAFK